MKLLWWIDSKQGRGMKFFNGVARVTKRLSEGWSGMSVLLFALNKTLTVGVVLITTPTVGVSFNKIHTYLKQCLLSHVVSFNMVSK